MYESLLCLPYFQGMSKDDITAILGKVTVEFKRYGEGETIFRRGDSCDQLVILTQGRISSTATAPDETFTITEKLHAPIAIEPYSLFGYETNFKKEYTACEKCTLLTIDKQHIFGELSNHNVFIMNFLNIICRRAQLMPHNIWNYTHTSIKGRIARFIALHCDTPRGEIKMNIKMERLATLLNETRLNISKALNEMQDSGHLTLHRGSITIHAIEKTLKDFE